MTDPTKKPARSEDMEEMENRPITGETVEQGTKQESPTGREWDAERNTGVDGGGIGTGTETT